MAVVWVGKWVRVEGQMENVLTLNTSSRTRSRWLLLYLLIQETMFGPNVCLSSF